MNKRSTRCCFSGHRPEKLCCREADLRVALRQEIELAYRDGYRTFLSGMARGVDIVAAELVIELKEAHPEMRLICVQPYPGFEARWSSSWQGRLRRVLAHADWVRTVCAAFSYASYQARNEWMIDHSSSLIAVYNGQPGGTQNTLAYARLRHIEIRLIDI